MSSDFVEPAGSLGQSNGYLLIIAFLIFGYLCVHARAPSVTGQTDDQPQPFRRQSALTAKTSEFDEQLRAFEAGRLRSYARRLGNASPDHGGSGYEGGQEYDHDLSGMDLDLVSARDGQHGAAPRPVNPYTQKRFQPRDRARAVHQGQIAHTASPSPAPVSPAEMHPIDSVRAELLAYRQTPPHVDVTSRQSRPHSRRDSPPHRGLQGQAGGMPSSKQQVQMFARNSMAQVCDKCNKAFVDLYSLSQHEAATHNPATRTADMTPRGHDWQCDVCDYSTFKQTSFIQHMGGKHRRLDYQLDPTRLLPLRYSAPANGFDHPGPSPMPGSDRRHAQSWLMHNPTLHVDHITPDPDPTLPDVQKTWRCTQCDEVFYTADERNAHEKDAVFHGDKTARDEAFPALSAASSRSTSGTYASAARAAASRSSSPLKKDVTDALVSTAEGAEPPVTPLAPGDQVNLDNLAENGPPSASHIALRPWGWEDSADATDPSVATSDEADADRSFHNIGAIDTDHPLPSFALEPTSRASPAAIGLLDDDDDEDVDDGASEVKEPIVIYDDFRWGEDIEPPGPPGMAEFPKLPSMASLLLQAPESHDESPKGIAAKVDRSEAASAAAAAAEARLASLNRGNKLSDAPPMTAPDVEEAASFDAPRAPVSRWHTDEKPTFTLPDLSKRVSKSRLPANDESPAGIFAHARQASQSPTSPTASQSASISTGSQMPSWASDVGSEFAEEMPGEMIGLEPELSAANSVPIGGRSGVSRWAGITPSVKPEWARGADYPGSNLSSDEPHDDYGWGEANANGNGRGMISSARSPQASQDQAMPHDDGWGAPLPGMGLSRSNGDVHAQEDRTSTGNGPIALPNASYGGSVYRPAYVAPRSRGQTQLPNFAPAVEDQPFDAFPHSPPDMIDTLGPRPAPVNALPSAWTASNRSLSSPGPTWPTFAPDGDNASNDRPKSKPVLMLDEDDEDDASNAGVECDEDQLVTIAVPDRASAIDSGWASAQWRQPKAPSPASLSGFSTSGSVPEYEHSRSGSERSASSGKGAKSKRQGRNQHITSTNSSNHIHIENQTLNVGYPNDGAGYGSAMADEYGRGEMSLNPRAKEWRAASPTNIGPHAKGSNVLMAHFPGFNQVDANGWTIASPTPSHATANANALAHDNGGARDLGPASGWEDASAHAGWTGNGYAAVAGSGGRGMGERRKGRGGKLQPRTTWGQQLEAGARAQQEQQRMAAETLSKRGERKRQARASVPGATTKVAAVVDDAEDEYGGW